MKGIEPSYSAWKAAALPLSYTRDLNTLARSHDPRILFLFFAVYKTLGEGEIAIKRVPGLEARRSARRALPSRCPPEPAIGTVRHRMIPQVIQV